MQIDVKRAIMQELGIRSIDDLYVDVPKKFRVSHKLNLPDPLSEYELKKHVSKLLSKNKTSDNFSCYLGGGCWPHYVPAVVKEIVQRSEFLTCYTPYQPETSQGTLQALFEYQSLLSELTDMDVVNCSMYDWASALGEAARMAVRVTKRSEILVPHIIHPERKATLKVYANPVGIKIREIGYDPKTGLIDLDDLKSKISNNTAAVYFENPSYFGIIDPQVDELAEITKKHGALQIVGVDPTSLGVLRPPGDYGADIVVGEAQPLGNEMNFGGPLLGLFACRDEMKLIRQMPGRLIGLTNTKKGDHQGFCMVLQTREQHIRREKATSNICSNQALCAIASAVYMALLGAEGLKQLGKTIVSNTNYAQRVLARIKGIEVPVFESAYFKEFPVKFERSMTVKKINQELIHHKIHGGKDISSEFSELGNVALYCVTEIHSQSELEYLTKALKEIVC